MNGQESADPTFKSNPSLVDRPSGLSASDSRFDRKVVRIDPRPPETMHTPQNGATPLLQETAFNSVRSFVSQKSSTTSAYGLSLYEDDATTMPTIAAYLRSFTIPGPEEKEQSELSGAGRPKVTYNLVTDLIS